MRALVVALLFASPAFATSVAEVPDPRPTHQVIDLTRTLTNEDVTAIDRAAAGATNRESLVVVVVPGTDGTPSRAWATQLFNRLRIDSSARNRGVLLLVALADHHAEIVLGDGWPQGTAQATDAIMRDVIVAKMKTGDARAAVVDGAVACAAIDPNAQPNAQPAPPQTIAEKVFAGVFAVVGVVAFIAFFLVLVSLVRRVFRFIVPVRCPKCHARGYKTTSTIKTRATLTAGGIDVVTGICAACGYTTTFETATAMVTASDRTSHTDSSSSSGGSSSGGGSSGSW